MDERLYVVSKVESTGSLKQCYTTDPFLGFWGMSLFPGKDWRIQESSTLTTGDYSLKTLGRGGSEPWRGKERKGIASKQRRKLPINFICVLWKTRQAEERTKRKLGKKIEKVSLKKGKRETYKDMYRVRRGESWQFCWWHSRGIEIRECDGQ